MLPNLLLGKVYDCFIFFNELETLDIRFNELYDHVDHFVIVEANETFSGIAKPYYFEVNKERYAQFLDKIIYIKLDKLPTAWNEQCVGKYLDEKAYNENQENNFAWMREFYQRNQLMQGLKDCNSDDVIILSDCDEIPEGRSIKRIKELVAQHEIVSIENLCYYYFLNRLYNWAPESSASCALSYNDLKKSPTISTIRQWSHEHIVYDNPEDHRYRKRNTPITCMISSGWHFSSQGGYERIKYKFSSFSHYKDDFIVREINQDYLDWRETVEEKTTLVPIDDTYPEYILKNIEYFREIGFIDDSI